MSPSGTVGSPPMARRPNVVGEVGVQGQVKDLIKETATISACTSSTFRPFWAWVIERLDGVVDLPSPGTALGTLSKGDRAYIYQRTGFRVPLRPRLGESATSET